MDSTDVTSSSERAKEGTSRRWESGDVRPLLVRPRIAWKMLGCGNTHGYELLAAGELESFRDGRSRKITVQSIHQYIERRLKEGVSLRKPNKVDE